MEGRARTSAGGIPACDRRGCGLKAGRVRALGGEGAGFGRGTERRSSGRAVPSDGDTLPSAQEAAAGAGITLRSAGMWWALATDAAVSSRETRRSYQPGTLRSDAAAIWKYRHSASSYSGSSASSSSAARMCRSHASCAAIPIAKRA